MRKNNIFKKTSGNLLNILSLIIAITSLIIAFVSLRIAEKVYYLSSKDFVPQIDFEITDSILKVENKSNDLFKLEEINIMGVEVVGFEEYKTNTIVQIPIVRLSRSEYIFDNDRSRKEYVININDASALWELRPIRDTLYALIKIKIENEYGIDSKKGYAVPYLQTYYYYVSITYKDPFNNFKSIFYKYTHLHGIGEYKKINISEDVVINFMNNYKMPPQKSFNEIWEYLIKKYSENY